MKHVVFKRTKRTFCRMLISALSGLLPQSGRLCQALRGRISELEAELAEQSHLKQQALSESEFLRAELDDLRRVKEDTEKEQRSLTEIESKNLLPNIFAKAHSSYTPSLRTFSRWVGVKANSQCPLLVIPLRLSTIMAFTGTAQ